MSKKFLLLIAAVVAAGGVLWGVAHWYAEREASLPPLTETQLAGELRRVHPDIPEQPSVVAEAPLSPGKVVRVALGGLGLPDDTQNGQLGDLVAVDLTGAKGVELVERPALQKVLQELQLNLSGLVRAQDAVRAGQLLRADWFLLGSSMRLQERDSLLIRLVDARTGVIRDAGVFAADKGLSALASDLATFVRQSRELAQTGKPRLFVAVGRLVNVGVNNRQATFPEQLAGYITDAYRNSTVTVLEREQVSTLLQEIRLDLAGLTQQNAGATASPMQSAFWLLDGFYQSSGDTGQQVELVLRINRVFGLRTSTTLRGLPSELCPQVKQALDSALAGASAKVFAPTRASELKQQLALAKELFHAAVGLNPAQMPSPGYRNVGAGEPNTSKRKYYLEEAIRACQSALLLDPQSSEAKVHLSGCYRDWSIGKYEEGAGLLREVAANATDPQWATTARVALGWFYMSSDGRESARWFEEAANRAQPPGSGDGYRHLAQLALTDAATHESADIGGTQMTAQATELLRGQLFAEIQSAEDMLRGKSGGISCSYGLDHFAEAYGTNEQAAADAVNQLWPVLKEKFPALAPHLLSSVVSFQVDTNAPVLEEFRSSLRVCTEHPQQLLRADYYFKNLLCNTYDWCMRKKLFLLAAELAEATRRAALEKPSVQFTDPDKVRLGFAYMRAQRWADALSAFELLGDAPVTVGQDGPWGPAFRPFLPAKSAALCREKLGLPPVQLAGRFDLGKPCLCLHTPSAFAASDDGLWVAIAGKLIQLDLQLKTNRQLSLPVSARTPLTAACAGTDRVWIGTAGEGLLGYDKTTGKIRRFTENDGLLLNYVSKFFLDHQTLWIGFARDFAGGVGRLDLATGRLTSFTPALTADPFNSAGSPNGPPRDAVCSLAVDQAGDLWTLAPSGAVRRYACAQDSWSSFRAGNGTWLSCLASSGDKLIGGFSMNQVKIKLAPDPAAGQTNSAPVEQVVTAEEVARILADPKMRTRYLGSVGGDTLPNRCELRWRALNEDRWQPIAEDLTLPAPPNCLVIAGSDVWLGGSGYVAVTDFNRNNLRKLCRISARGVDQLQVAAGYLWAKFDRHLYRVALSAVQ